MTITVTMAREFCRIAHREDDPAIALAIEAAEAELEARTGRIVRAGTLRTQTIDSDPTYSSGGRVMAAFEPVTAADHDITIEPRNGRSYLVVPEGLEYPLVVTLTCGGGADSLPALLRLALLTRIAQMVSYRGDDAAPPSDRYWQDVCAMVGKGIA